MKNLAKIERFVGSVKFAVIIVLAFAAYLTYGTFIESLYNTDYANRLVYKSIPFMLLQLAMFLSIFIATTLRFPYKKRLLGFYVLHLGLLLLFVGSFVTYIVGVDGNMELFPNTPTRTVKLPKYQLVIKDLNSQKQYISDLPYTPDEINLDKTFKELKLQSYYPFAKLEREWVKSNMESTRSSHYLLKNENFTQDFLLSSHPDSEAKASINLGPLNIHYLPRTLANCFDSVEGQPNELSGYILWDINSDQCFRPDSSNSKIETNQSSQEILVFRYNNQEHVFIPGVSPLPVERNTFQIQANSPMRIFSKKLFEKRPHLFAFGDKVAYYDKDEQKWFAEEVNSSEPTPLPWMGFEISLIKDSLDTYPTKRPVFSPPKANKNRIHAVQVRYNDELVWATNQAAARIGNYEVLIRPEQIKVPFQINLERFNMDKDPGTQNPASYESYVNVFDGKDSRYQKVFMNNPLDFDQFTFYQASYFPLESGLYGSVFSVNYDPGRFLKYLGSLLLVLGSFWHFYIRNRKWKWLKA